MKSRNTTTFTSLTLSLMFIVGAGVSLAGTRGQAFEVSGDSGYRFTGGGTQIGFAGGTMGQGGYDGGGADGTLPVVGQGQTGTFGQDCVFVQGSAIGRGGLNDVNGPDGVLVTTSLGSGSGGVDTGDSGRTGDGGGSFSGGGDGNGSGGDLGGFNGCDTISGTGSQF